MYFWSIEINEWNNVEICFCISNDLKTNTTHTNELKCALVGKQYVCMSDDFFTEACITVKNIIYTVCNVLFDITFVKKKNN